MKKRIFSLLLTLCLVVGMLPTVAYAYDNINTINNGEFNEDVNNRGAINGGTFNKAVTNSGIINNGEFNNTVTNTPGSYINDGTFNDIVYSRGGCQITDGTFNNTVNNDSASDYILGGTFNATVNNNSGAKIQGGTFNGSVNNTGTAKIQNGTFYSTVNNNFDCDITGGTFYGDVENNGTITGGTFYGTITGSGTLSGATYRRIVTFDSNGGSEVSSQDILKDSTATKPTVPTKEDYTFEGWYNGDTLYDFDTPVTENIILTAKWTVDRIKLTKAILESSYKSSNRYILPDGHYYLGENIFVDNSIYIGDTSTPSNVIIDLNGYELRKDSNGALLFLQNDSTLTVMDSSVTKSGKIVSGYAIWFSSGSTLNANGGTVEGNVAISGENAKIDNTDSSNVTAFYNGNIYSANSSTVFNGGVFYSTVNCSGQITGGTFYDEVTNNGTITGGTFYGTVSGPGLIEDSAKVTINFNSDGGTNVDEQKIVRGQKATAPTEPTKVGYDFDSWYKGTTEFDFANTPVIENITLKAKWSGKSSITFDTNPQSYTYDGTAQAFSITGTTVTGFDISYKQNGQAVINPTNVGSYDVIVTRAEDSTHKVVNMTISNGLVINPKAVTATISAIPDETYTGSNIEPNITIYDGQTVIPASEYTVSYSDNKNIGTAMVILDDKSGGNYIVSGTTTFVILPKSIEDAVITLNGKLTYNGTEQTQNVSVTLDGFETVTFDVSNNKQTDVNPSSDYTLTVTGNGNFTGTKNFNWNIAPATPTENPTKKTTARVIKGKTLDNATVMNGEIFGVDGTTVLTGTFAWVDSTKVMGADGTEQMVFTPDNTNYASITIDVAVSTYTIGGGSGGGNSSTYQVNVESTKNGIITMNHKSASKGTTVTLTVTPNKGYTLETLRVLDSSNKEIKLTEKDGKYTFVMPASKVTVKATFMEDNTMLNFFVDIPIDAYYYDAVLWAVKNGITSGTDAVHFSPNAPCTRAQIITFLWRAAGSPIVNYAMNLEDVPSDAYYAEAVRWALSMGITKGTGKDTFNPNGVCNRAQAMTFIYRNEQANGGGFKGNWMFRNPFSDVELENYYGEAVMWAIANGVTIGTTESTFSPNNDCTRAQIITFLYRFYENVLKG